MSNEATLLEKFTEAALRYINPDNNALCRLYDAAMAIQEILDDAHQDLTINTYLHDDKVEIIIAPGKKGRRQEFVYVDEDTLPDEIEILGTEAEDELGEYYLMRAPIIHKDIILSNGEHHETPTAHTYKNLSAAIQPIILKIIKETDIRHITIPDRAFERLEA